MLKHGSVSSLKHPKLRRSKTQIFLITENMEGTLFGFNRAFSKVCKTIIIMKNSSQEVIKKTHCVLLMGIISNIKKSIFTTKIKLDSQRGYEAPTVCHTILSS